MPNEAVCCPEYVVGSLADQVLEWNEKVFVKDRVRCLFHIPLNFSAVMKRSGRPLIDAGLWQNQMLVLSDEKSNWYSDVYIELEEDEGVETPPLHAKASRAKFSGKFVTKECEGPYQKAHVWAKDFRDELEAKGIQVNRILFNYRTCPKCAKKYGKNWIVLFAEVE
ncbi:hydrolase [Poriferisphaera sp. WC338]|uniref:hydrolase n=1 Tax=Poriferisphaera sp. WC338 TaxID=3425129 RepID=UPI003D816A3E